MCVCVCVYIPIYVCVCACLKQFFLWVIEITSTQERAEELIEQVQLKKLDLGVCK